MSPPQGLRSGTSSGAPAWKPGRAPQRWRWGRLSQQSAGSPQTAASPAGLAGSHSMMGPACHHPLIWGQREGAPGMRKPCYSLLHVVIAWLRAATEALGLEPAAAQVLLCHLLSCLLQRRRRCTLSAGSGDQHAAIVTKACRSQPCSPFRMRTHVGSHARSRWAQAGLGRPQSPCPAQALHASVTQAYSRPCSTGKLVRRALDSSRSTAE